MLAAKLLAAGGGAETLYAEDVFSAYTYTGNGSTQTITNGINLAGKGGMVWIKHRTSASYSHTLHDTTRGATKTLHTDTTDGSVTDADFSAFNSNGFSVAISGGTTNLSSASYVSWTFRNADKFYNHTTVVKTGGSNATVSFSNLTTLGMVRVKRTDAAGSWYIWHRSLTSGKLLIGETTAAEATLGHITVSGTTVTLVNGVIADGTYLVEGFAHDTGPDGLIQCGSLPTSGTVSLGWEPQFVLWKDAPSGWWYIYDTARGFTTLTAGVANGASLNPNNSNAESFSTPYVSPNPTGFSINSATGATSIYLAIRRPNKPPTTGTQVYNAIARTGTGAAATVTGVGFAPDLVCSKNRGEDCYAWHDRLRGVGHLRSDNTSATSPSTQEVKSYTNDGVNLGTSDYGVTNFSAASYINHFFKRAPGVFDVVCYTGTGSATTVVHGLGAVPELMIVKARNDSTRKNWVVYAASQGNTKSAWLESTLSFSVTGYAEWNTTSPTSSVFSVGSEPAVNQNGYGYAAYLFATLAGISKVFSYTGNGGTAGSAGTSQTINCGFTTGARFVMLKCTSHTSDWVVVDTTRGLIAGNDPALSLNTTAAEVTTTDLLDPDTSGFIVNQLATGTTSADFNVTGRTYIGLAFS